MKKVVYDIEEYLEKKYKVTIFNNYNEDKIYKIEENGKLIKLIYIEKQSSQSIIFDDVINKLSVSLLEE
ncbi:MAG TPA: hypothetical protein K8V99_08245 [Megamonas funiformis]|uniref:hypothetical protein n=1 Tax=Enterococcus cecorum TaxID=44008 RepID=UPI00148CD580|nr:hypothetical protein [Enterococcus cecorum]HJG04554.1 hypothetical protein [Megamonas funiformis]